MRLTWSAKLRTGIRDIDLQHQELIDIIGELEDVFELGRGDGAIDHVLQRLSSYVVFHFETEEALLHSEVQDADHAHRHLQEHREFGFRCSAFQALSAEERRQSLGTMLNYLKSWLASHVMISDQELARLARAKSEQGDSSSS